MSHSISTTSPPGHALAAQSGGRVSSVLAANRLGVPAIVFFTLSAAAPLTVVAGAVTTGFATTGLVGVPVGFLAVGAVLLLFSVGYVAMSRRVANAGAFYTYVAAGLGRPTGVGAAWVALAAYNALQVALYGAIGVAVSPLLDQWFSITAPWWVIALAVWALVGALGVLRVEINGSVLAVLLVAEVAVILVYSATSLANPAGGSISTASLSPGNLVGSGVGAILVLAVMGFIGFESAPVFSEESKNPRKTVPTATYISVIGIALLYTLSSWALTVGVGPSNVVGEAQKNGPELLFGTAGQHLGSGWVDAGHVLFFTSLVAAMISFHNTTARYAFALGREHVLPGIFGKTNRFGAPVVGSLTQTILGIAVISLYATTGWDPLVQLFFWGGTAGGLGVLLLITVTSAAVVAYFAKRKVITETTEEGDRSIWRQVAAPVLALGLLVTVSVLAVVNLRTLLGVTPDSPLPWIIPAVFTAVALLGVGWGFVLRAFWPDTYARIGLGPRAATAAAAGPSRPGTEPGPAAGQRVVGTSQVRR